MCAPAGPHVTTSQPFGCFSLATRLQRGEDSGAREAKRTGVSGDANTLQHNTITIGSPSHRGCCVCLCANGRESSVVGVRLNRRWPAVFLATRTGRRHSEPHSRCASSLRYTGTCSATAVQPAHQCLNVPPFVVAGHGELSWPRGQALGPEKLPILSFKQPSHRRPQAWRWPVGVVAELPMIFQVIPAVTSKSMVHWHWHPGPRACSRLEYHPFPLMFM